MQRNALTDYQATKPRYSSGYWAKNIIARIVFPPILLWDGLKFLVNKIAGAALGKEILIAQKPGAFDPLSDRLNDEKDMLAFNDAVKSNHWIVRTHDGAELDTIQIQPKDDMTSPDKALYIVNFVGNAMTYHLNLDQMAIDAQVLNCTVIGFDYRGVMNSTGCPQQSNDLVTDGVAQIQRLLDAGANPENITLKGHSLGGGIATLVAKHFHDLGIKVNLFNDRSFSSLANLAIGHVRTKQPDASLRTAHDEKLSYKILGHLARPIIMLSLALTKWEINAAHAYHSIPDTHKAYLFVRSSKEQRRGAAFKPKDDAVITHYGALHNSFYLKLPRRKFKRRLQKEIDAINANSATHALISQNMANARHRLRKMQEKLNECKVESLEMNDNAHVVSLSRLISRYRANDGYTLFRNFVINTHEHHQQVADITPQRP